MKMFWTIFLLGSMFLIGFDARMQGQTVIPEDASTSPKPIVIMNDPMGIPPGN